MKKTSYSTFVFLALTSLLLGSSACTKKTDAPAESQPAAAAAKPADTGTAQVATATAPAGADLKIEDSKVGDGAEAQNGKKVTVHYTGTLTDGKKFDSSLDHGKPFEFRLGDGMVIPGWEKGLLGMKVGGKRKLTIPPAMGYGERGAGDAIPPNSTLLFDIELLKVE